ncbi:MAG: hypothetical protein Q7R77_03205 [Candidatus Daviesbacteria bacterium]|nr:hypothetical protein [Candidatus Daviesbacteria bacterium]
MSYIEFGRLSDAFLGLRIRLDDRDGFIATARDVVKDCRVCEQLNLSPAEGYLFQLYFAYYYARKTNGPPATEYDTRKFIKQEKIADELLEKAQVQASLVDTDSMSSGNSARVMNVANLLSATYTQSNRTDLEELAKRMQATLDRLVLLR